MLKRTPETLWLGLVIVLLAATVVLLIVLAGADPVRALRGLLDGAFGDRYAIAETIVQSVPIAIVALGVAPALRAGIFPVGSEGQLAIGAVPDVSERQRGARRECRVPRGTRPLLPRIR